MDWQLPLGKEVGWYFLLLELTLSMYTFNNEKREAYTILRKELLRYLNSWWYAIIEFEEDKQKEEIKKMREKLDRKAKDLENYIENYKPPTRFLRDLKREYLMRCDTSSKNTKKGIVDEFSFFKENING